MQGVLANLLAKKQELSELLALKASLEKQLLQQEGESDDEDGAEVSLTLTITRTQTRTPALARTRALTLKPVARIPASARPSTRPLSAPPSDHPRARVPGTEFDTSMAEPEREGSAELRAVLEHRRRAQQAVTEQERKLPWTRVSSPAELTLSLTLILTLTLTRWVVGQARSPLSRHGAGLALA